MSAKIGVVLSGCGVQDGSEIHEAVSILITLDRRGAHVICMAPGGPQASVVNHVSNKPQGLQRDMLVESARIARGNIRDISTVTVDEMDAIIFPGGYGVVKNLCSFAVDGPQCKVHPEVRRLITEMHAARKPIGLACIAPVLVARVLGEAGVKPKMTIGTDADTAGALNAMGAVHQDATPTGIVVDEDNRLVSTPCYMNDVGPWVVYQGAERMVEQVLNMSGDPDSLYRQRMATIL